MEISQEAGRYIEITLEALNCFEKHRKVMRINFTSKIISSDECY